VVPGYLLIVSRSAEIRRVFQYHGAEHMTIHALEHDDPLTIGDPGTPPRSALRYGVPIVIVSILLQPAGGCDRS
jgi:uncharacterized protein YqhQ